MTCHACALLTVYRLLVLYSLRDIINRIWHYHQPSSTDCRHNGHVLKKSCNSFIILGAPGAPGAGESLSLQLSVGQPL